MFKINFYYFLYYLQLYNKLLINIKNNKIYFTRKKIIYSLLFVHFMQMKVEIFLCVHLPQTYFWNFSQILFVLLLSQSRTWQILRLLKWVAFNDVAVDLCGSSCSDELFCLAALYSVESCSANWNKNSFRCICIPVVSL